MKTVRFQRGIQYVYYNPTDPALTADATVTDVSELAAAVRRGGAVPRRRPRAAMEVLAVVAYHQPVTRADIEARRGTSLSQATLDLLLEASLIAPAGRRDAPGRPTLWVTTPVFLAQFGLRDPKDLPRREDLLIEPPSLISEPLPDESPGPPVT